MCYWWRPMTAQQSKRRQRAYEAKERATVMQERPGVWQPPERAGGVRATGRYRIEATGCRRVYDGCVGS